MLVEMICGDIESMIASSCEKRKYESKGMSYEANQAQCWIDVHKKQLRQNFLRLVEL